LSVAERFKTQNNNEYNKDNFRRIMANTFTPADFKDLKDASNFNDGS